MRVADPRYGAFYEVFLEFSPVGSCVIILDTFKNDAGTTNLGKPGVKHMLDLLYYSDI